MWCNVLRRAAGGVGEHRSTHRRKTPRGCLERPSTMGRRGVCTVAEPSPGRGRQSLCDALFLPALLSFCVSCVPSPPTLPPRLPPAPTLDWTQFEPAVREQLQRAAKAAGDTRAAAVANAHMAKLLIAYGWNEQAMLYLRRAVVLKEDEESWWYLKGRLEAKSGNLDAAKLSLERALSISETLPTLLTLGRVALDANTLEGAHRWYRRAVELSPDSPHAHEGLAQVLLRRGEHAEAQKEFLRALEKEPRYARAHYGLARLYQLQGARAEAFEALKAFETGIKDLPYSDPVWESVQSLKLDADHLFRQANSLLKAGRFDDAIAAYKEAQGRNDHLPLADYNIGLALQKSGRAAEAITYFERFLEKRPRYVEAHNNLALCLFELGRYSESLTHLERAVEIEPRYARALFNLGLVHEQRGDIDAAVASVRRSLELRPNHAEAHFTLGRLLERSDRKQAFEHYLVAIALRPLDERIQQRFLAAPGEPLSARGFPLRGEPFQRLADFLRQRKLSEAAISVLRVGQREVPEDAPTRVFLAWVLATTSVDRLRKPAESLEILRPLRAKLEDDPRFLDVVAAAQAAVGEFAGAVGTAEKAMSLGREKGLPIAEIERRLSLYRQNKPYRE